MTIFDFSDYRAYLRKYISLLPKKGRGSINRMASAMGVHPSLLSQVLADDKHLNLEQGQQLALYLGLADVEEDYFLTMILYQRAGTEALKKYHRKKLEALKQHANELVDQIKQDRKLGEEEKAVFFSHWHYNAVWLMTSIGEGKNLDEIVQNLQISRERAKGIIDFLVKSHLCIAGSGYFKMGPQSIHLERSSPFIFRHHTNWRLRALERNHQLSANELMYTGPISLSKADFEVIRNKLTEVIKNFTQTAVDSPAEDMACLNLDFFWIK
jgi:uncharacterized protein (TIGR02147 family)